MAASSRGRDIMHNIIMVMLWSVIVMGTASAIGSAVLIGILLGGPAD